MSTKQWLAAHGYDGAVQAIALVEKGWKERGVRTRRNWWVKLAGGAGGTALQVDGVVFPVLAVAQLREGKVVTRNAIPARGGEEPPPKEAHGRSLTLLRQREREAGSEVSGAYRVTDPGQPGPGVDSGGQRAGDRATRNLTP